MCNESCRQPAQEKAMKTGSISGMEFPEETLNRPGYPLPTSLRCEAKQAEFNTLVQLI